MSEYITVARPYAKAAFDFAVEQKNIEAWQQMIAFAADVSQDDQIAKLITSDMKADQLADLFIAACGEQLDEYGHNFIKIMALNHRLATLPDVIELFTFYRAEHDSKVEVEVISAKKLSKEQQKKITAAMKKRLSHSVKLNCKIDKSVIAGVIIRSGDLVIDGSVKSRLERLADTLQS